MQCLQKTTEPLCKKASRLAAGVGCAKTDPQLGQTSLEPWPKDNASDADRTLFKAADHDGTTQ